MVSIGIIILSLLGPLLGPFLPVVAYFLLV
jgi:hypothetical protein